jgi:hypothetical protein
VSVDPLPYILARLKIAAENDWAWSLTPVEASRIVEEVERLRAAEGQRDLIVRENAHWFREQGREQERAVVVAWLRAAPTARMWRQEPMEDAANLIERGEHCREEGE